MYLNVVTRIIKSGVPSVPSNWSEVIFAATWSYTSTQDVTVNVGYMPSVKNPPDCTNTQACAESVGARMTQR